jgi:hypothetical protein
MDSEPFLPDVLLDVHFEGRVVHSIRLDPALSGELPAAATAGSAPIEPDRPFQAVVIQLPRAGQMRIDLQLHRPNLGSAGFVRRTTYVFDGSATLGPVVSERTTVTYLVPAAPPVLPDEPQIVG